MLRVNWNGFETPGPGLVCENQIEIERERKASVRPSVNGTG